MVSSRKVGLKVVINLRLLQGRYTGVQSYVYNFVRSLVNSGKDTNFKLVVFAYDGNNKFIEDLKSRSNVTIANILGIKNSLTDILFDQVFIDAQLSDADVYFSPVNILPIRKRPNIKYIVGVLDLCTFIVPETTTRQLKAYYDLFLSSSLHRADQIITISENTKYDLHKLFHIGTNKVTTIPLGIDHDIVRKLNNPQTFISRIGLNKSDHFFLTIGSSKRKNPEHILEAFGLLDSNTKIVIVVSDPFMIKYLEDFLSTKKYRSRVILTRTHLSKQELNFLYSKAIGLVYCSYYEGFGLPVLEAMQNLCPVIASNNSSLPEVVGKAGILVDPLNIRQVKQAMNKLSTNKTYRSKLIKLGLINTKKYSWETAAKKLLKLFQK